MEDGNIDEFTAITLREMLKSRKINAEIRRFETTGLDGVPKLMQGEVLVAADDLKLAEECIAEFLAAPAKD